VNRRSKVIRVISPFELESLEVAKAAWVEAMSQSSPPPDFRLLWYKQDCGFPSPPSVTVTFSHQGALETSVSVEEVVVEAVAVAAVAPAIAAEATNRAASLSTFKLLRARRSGDLIAAANLNRPTRRGDLVSVRSSKENALGSEAAPGCR
jgi:hypothetical protein